MSPDPKDAQGEDDELSAAYSHFRKLVNQERGVVGNATLVAVEQLHGESTNIRTDVQENLTLARGTDLNIQSILDTTENVRKVLENRQATEELGEILPRLSTLDFHQKQKEVYAKYHRGTGRWLLECAEFERWLTAPQAMVLWCLGNPGAGKTVMTIFLTSRPHVDPREHFANTCCINIAANIADIKAYLAHTINKNSRISMFARKDAKLREDIVEVLSQKATGMFLLPHLQMERLCNQTNLKAVRATMTAMPKGVSEYYEDVLKRIEDQPEEDKVLAKKALTYVFYAKRPLSLAELTQILAVEAGDTDLDPYASPEPEILRHACAGLITIGEQGATVRLVHSTVQEHLETHCDRLVPEPEVAFAKVCLAYLSFDIFDEGPSISENELQGRLKNYPFSEYVSNNWGYHVVGNQLHEELAPLLSRFLEQPNKLASSVQILSIPLRRRDNQYDLFPKQHGALHVVAYWGLDNLVSSLLRDGMDVNSQDSYGTTPLILAAKNCHKLAAQLLLEKGAEINARNNRGETALYWAARNGHEAMVDFLLKKGASVLMKDDEGWTALDWAVVGSNSEVVKILLKNGVSSTKGRGRALFLASDEGHEQTVQMLLNSGVDVNAKDYLDSSPLDWAVPPGHMETVTVLLRHGADVKSRDAYGNSALHWATPHPSIVRLLLEYGIEVDAKNDAGQTPLLWAAQDGYVEVAALLLKNKADINTQDIYGFTALHRVVLRGREAMVSVLLENGADLNIRNEDGWTPLHVAAIKRHEHLIQRLIDLVDQGTSILSKITLQLQDTRMQALFQHTAERKAEANTVVERLSAAVQYGQIGKSQFLIDRGADVNEKGSGGWTPLIIAASCNSLEGVQLLLDNGADVDIAGYDGRTALHWASECGHKRVAQLLVKHGADVNSSAHTWTPGLLAAQRGHTGILHFLIDHGADVHADDYHRRTALHWVAQHGSAESLRFLADNGADLNAVDRWGRTPLMWAIENKQELTALLLLELGADVQKKARHDITALHMAVFLECELAIPSLLARGADIDAEARCIEPDEDGFDALVAIDTPYTSLTDFIRQCCMEQDSAVGFEVGVRHGLTVRRLAASVGNSNVQSLLRLQWKS
ncbi:hypothetical protein AYO22_01804 [Fonsecaea multimorphosa]|nr:hypothetical protein AYO22_01804 [Fonsecaea multimorphosa]